jgi:hypothetical protein
MNESDFNKREEGSLKTSSQIQSNHGRAKIRKVGAGINVSFKGGNVAGKQSLVYKSNLSARQTNSLANTEVDYQESTRLEDQRNGTELYSVRCYDCD